MQAQYPTAPADQLAQKSRVCSSSIAQDCCKIRRFSVSNS
jgi:hypothetical protein